MRVVMFYRSIVSDWNHGNAHSKIGDVVWIGDRGDDERSEEIREFFVEPVKKLGLKAMAYGVRYPPHALSPSAPNWPSPRHPNR